MLFLVVVAALLCSSSIQPSESLSVFLPDGLSEAACTGTFLWTKWFDTDIPSDNGNLDIQSFLLSQATKSFEVCERPIGLQAQSVDEHPAYSSYPYRSSTKSKIIAAFRAATSGVDFQVRYCCANTGFVPTDTTTTTPRPITSSTCGRAAIKNSFASRIFGGSEAVPNSWPWQVLYVQKFKRCEDDPTCGILCGGTLIDSRHVLTARHCVGTTDPTLITITAGLHNQSNDESDTRQVRIVERIFVHPESNSETGQNDIAILRLAEPVEFNKYVQPACLPGPDPQPDADVILIGWGAIERDGVTSDELKETKVKVIGECKRYLGQVNEEIEVCVGDRINGSSVCSGDSGGPMLYEHNGQWIVAGVTSSGSVLGCSVDSAFVPNVFTRVSAYLPWIQTIVSQD